MFKRLALVVCLPFLAAPAAQAANHGWYWGIEAGFDHPNHFSYFDTSSFRTYTDQMDTGAAIVGTLGGYIGPQLRVEGELGYRWDDFTYSGDWSEVSLLGNIIYDMPLGADLVASIGGGIGADLVASPSQSDIGFAYQFLAGLAWSISPQTAVTLQYRFTNASGPDFNSGAGAMEYNDLRHQSLTLGLRFGF